MIPTTRHMSVFLLSAIAGVQLNNPVEAQEPWRRPAAPDRVQLASEEMAKRGVVKVVGHWRDGTLEPGAGIILGHENRDLYLMTANHVVRQAEFGNANRIVVQFHKDSGREYEAKLYKYDDAADFAVVVMRGFYETRILDQLVKFPIDPGFSAASGGQTIKALGHPDDREWLITRGQTLPSMQASEISLSAGIAKQGNSGGALLDAGNRLVGMVTGGEGNVRDVGLPISAMTRFLDAWDVPYRMRIVAPLGPVLSQVRDALWQHDWKSLMGRSLEDDSMRSVYRGRVSLLESGKSAIIRYDKDFSFVELLSHHQAPAMVDEAWRVWVRAVADAVGSGYTVKESGKRIGFSRYKAAAWPTSRGVTLELFEHRGSIYFHAYEFTPAYGDTDEGRTSMTFYCSEYLE